ncbi:MAG: DUF1178 family protein [Sphingomonadales bacterium]|nr:DUF1178 family protein [Sphingomonadales bacterium]
MIVYELECHPLGHRFEGWFGSSGDFVRQHERGLVTCPHCGSSDIRKAPMAPRLARKHNSNTPQEPAPKPASPESRGAAGVVPAEAAAMIRALARMQAEALKRSLWVGDKFAETARAMHYGEQGEAPIHGEASLAEARDLLDEGIGIAPVLFPMAPPRQVN